MFDLRTHIRDEKTGRLKDENHYRLFIAKGGEFFERPVGSGNLWYKNGSEAGQLDDNGTIVVGKEHMAWTAPLTKDETILKALEEKDDKIASMEKMLAEREVQSIQSDQKPDQESKKAPEAPKMQHGKAK